MERQEDFTSLNELIKTKQYTTLRQDLSEMNDADVAAFLEEIDIEDAVKVLRILPKSMAADVFSYLKFSFHLQRFPGGADSLSAAAQRLRPHVL